MLRGSLPLVCGGDRPRRPSRSISTDASRPRPRATRGACNKYCHALSVKLATIRTPEGTRAVRIDDEEAVDLDAADVGDVLRRDDWLTWAASANGPRQAVADVDYAPLISAPDKIICCGLNYRNHIMEVMRELPTYPTLFAKYRSTLCVADDEIVIPTVSEAIDWEVELAVIIGRRGRSVSEDEASSLIAGYAVLNDVSRPGLSEPDHSVAPRQVLFEATTPLGPMAGHQRRVAGPIPRGRLRGRRRGEAEGRHRRPAVQPRAPRRATSATSSRSSPAT